MDRRTHHRIEQRSTGCRHARSPWDCLVKTPAGDSVIRARPSPVSKTLMPIICEKGGKGISPRRIFSKSSVLGKLSVPGGQSWLGSDQVKVRLRSRLGSSGILFHNTKKEESVDFAALLPAKIS